MSKWTKFRDILTERVIPAAATGGISEVVRKIIPKEGQDASEAATPYMDEARRELESAYGPYAEQGRKAYEMISPEYEAMMRDPSAFLNKMMEGYEPSKAYQMQRDEALKAAGNTAAAGGYRGNIQDLTQAAKITDVLQGQDMQQWLQNVMGLKQAGLAGQQGIYGLGAQAGMQLGSDKANIAGSIATMQYQKAMQDAANRNQFISSLLGLGGSILGGGIGAMAGGPMGAGIGSQIGGGLGGLGGTPQVSSYQPFSGGSPFGNRGWY